MERKVNAQGLYHYPWVEEYWHAPNAAYLFKAAGNYAGFCLVDNDVLLTNSEHSISEFFVLRKHPRNGGLTAALPHHTSSRHGLASGRSRNMSRTFRLRPFGAK